MIKNFVAKLLRTPKFKQRKVESKKKGLTNIENILVSELKE